MAVTAAPAAVGKLLVEVEVIRGSKIYKAQGLSQQFDIVEPDTFCVCDQTRFELLRRH